jgi:hypothetical protein
MTFFPGYTGDCNKLFYPVQNHNSTEHHEESSVEDYVLYSSQKSKIKIFQREKLIKANKTTFPRQKDKGFTLYVKLTCHPVFSHLITETVVLRT